MQIVDGEGEAQSASAYLDGVLGDSGEGTVKDYFNRWVGTAAVQHCSTLLFPIHLSIYPPIYLLVHLSIYRFVYLFSPTYLPTIIYLSIDLSVCMHVCLSVYLLIYLRSLRTFVLMHKRYDVEMMWTRAGSNTAGFFSLVCFLCCLFYFFIHLAVSRHGVRQGRSSVHSVIQLMRQEKKKLTTVSVSLVRKLPVHSRAWVVAWRLGELVRGRVGGCGWVNA